MIHDRRRFRNAAHALSRSCAPILESLEPRQHLTVTTLTRASVATDGTAPTGASSYNAISADGNWVAFESTAPNLVPGDTNDSADVFLRDLRNNTTIRISINADGVTEGNGSSGSPAVSPDGRYVAFLSSASNLVAGDTNDVSDIFLYDRLGNSGAGSIIRISVATDGTQADSDSSPPSMAVNGDHVRIAFHSNAANLVASDGNGKSDIFLYDLNTATSIHSTTLVSASGSFEGNDSSYNPAISGNGQFIGFISNATNFVAAGGDTNGVADVFVYNVETPSLERVSIKSGSETTANQANGPAGQRIALSFDGSFVVFESDATNLVTTGTGIPADTNGKTDIFLRNRTANTTIRVSTGTANNTAVVANGESRFPSISSNGRYVIYESDATNLLAGDTNGKSDVFLFDRLATTQAARRVSVSANGTQANDDSKYPSVSADGRYVSFFSKADNLIGAENDQNGVGDIFALVAPVTGVTGTPDGQDPKEIASGDNSPAGNDGTDFGFRDIADGPVTRTFTIRNTGTSPLILSGTNIITISGAHAADFTVLTQPSDAALAFGESATFTVRFDPSTPGLRAAKINFSSNDPATPTYTFDIQGTGLDSSNVTRLRIAQGTTVVANSSTHAIGNVARSSTATVYTYAVTNVSDQVLALAQVVLENASGFQLESPLGSLLLAPGQTTSFAIRIPANSAPGAKSVTVKLANTNPGDDTKNISFAVSATVQVSKITVLQSNAPVASGHTVAFGKVVKGQSAISKTFTIRNDGQAPLVLGTITPPAGYAVSSAPPSTIAPGGTGTIIIQLSSSTSVGTKNGQFTIVTNDPDVPTFIFNLTGEVTTSRISVQFNGNTFTSGTTVPFGNAALSQTVPTQSIVVTNTGTATLNLGTITVPTGFVLVDTASTARTVAPGDSVTIKFRLASTAVGAKSGDLTFSTNDSDQGTFRVKLTGNVVTQPFVLLINGVAATSQSIPFGTIVQSNTAVTKNITLRNDGAVTINLEDISLPAGFFLFSKVSKSSIAPGESAAFSVSFTPRASGAQSGILSIPTDGVSVRPKYELGLTANVTPASKTSLAVDTVTLGKLPSAVIGGTPTAVGTSIVTLNNYSSATLAGTYKITLYASEGTFYTAGDKVIGTATVKLNLKAKSKSSHTINLKFPSPPVDGKYHVVAVVTGAKVDPVFSTGRAPFTVKVEKPQAKVGQSGSAPKLTSKVGQKVTQTVTLSNTGNTTIVGTGIADVFLSKDGTTEDAIKIGKVSGLKINIAKAKGTQKVTFSVTLPKKLSGGYAAKATYTLLLKLTKIASGTASTLANDGVVNAGKITLK